MSLLQSSRRTIIPKLLEAIPLFPHIENLESRTLLAADLELVKDIFDGPSSGIQGLNAEQVVLNDIVYFPANDGVFGVELWRSDGTENGTELVKDIMTDASSSPVNLTAVGDLLYFSADSADFGRELWVSDGTENGTHIVQDLADGTASSNPSPPVVTEAGQVFFSADVDETPATDIRMFRILKDGSVKRVKLPASDADPIPRASVGNEVYFVYDDSNDPNNANDNFELWSVSTTGKNPHQIKDIHKGAKKQSTFSGFVVFNNKLFFVVTRSAQAGENLMLWKSDGTKAGTRKVAQLNTDQFANLESFTVLGTKLYFRLTIEANRQKLWVSEGKSKGTKVVRKITNDSSSALFGMSPPAQLGKRAFFTVSDDGKNELWKTRGTKANTERVKIIRQAADSQLGNPVNIDGILLFSAKSTKRGQELWTSDGTKAGTAIIEDIFTGAGSSNPSPPIRVGDAVLFNASTLAEGRELYRIEDFEDLLV